MICFRQEALYFFVARLRKVLIPLADSVKLLRSNYRSDPIGRVVDFVKGRRAIAGAATMIGPASNCRSAATAAIIVEPVAIPSSTR